jgi:hypothetical protein
MNTDHQPITSPWVLVDDLTVEQTAAVLQRLTRWLLTRPDAEAARDCSRAISLGETGDPATIASWTDALTARLCRLADQAQLDLPPTDHD